MTNPQSHYSLIKTHKSFCPQWLVWISSLQDKTHACKHKISRKAQKHETRTSVFNHKITAACPHRKHNRWTSIKSCIRVSHFLHVFFFSHLYIFRCNAVICLSDDAALLFFSISLGSLWIISDPISCRTGISAVAVALGGRWGTVPDRAASGTITEQVPDCSLLPSSSLSYFFPRLPFTACGPADAHTHTNAHTFFSHIQTVSIFY